jgi:hypothetical protein
MEPSAVLTVLAILVALLTVVVYALQTAELAEKRIAQITRWIKKRRQEKSLLGLKMLNKKGILGEQSIRSDCSDLCYPVISCGQRG